MKLACRDLHVHVQLNGSKAAAPVILMVVSWLCTELCRACIHHLMQVLEVVVSFILTICKVH